MSFLNSYDSHRQFFLYNRIIKYVFLYTILLSEYYNIKFNYALYPLNVLYLALSYQYACMK